MNLSNLKRPAGQVKNKRRIGQGMGTGRSKYAGRGAKGQKSISGYSKMRGFEGGQMPLHRRLPKRGFTNPFREEYAIINLGTLDKLEGASFDAESLKASGTVKSLGKGLKVLAHGELTRKISVKVTAISKAAEEKIKALGGSVEVLPERQPYIRDKAAEKAAKRAAKKK